MAEKDTDSKLDAIATHLDSLHKRMDAEAEERKADRARFDAACARMDAYDKERKDAEDKAKADAARKDAEEKERDEKAKADAARKDAEEKEAKEKEEKQRADKARADADAARASEDSPEKLRARIAELERTVAPITEDQRIQFSDVQGRAERVAQAFGDSAGAPRWRNGETLDQYRRRLLTPYKGHSPAWKDIDITVFDGKTLDVVESQVYTDAMREAMHPATVAAGTLRASIRKDDTGRQIRMFHGDPEACWGPFKMPSKLVTQWNTKFN